MTDDLKTELKKEIKIWEDSVNAINRERSSCNAGVKIAMMQLRTAKYSLGQANKNWVDARKTVKKLKAKLSRMDYVSRKWTKQNLGKVLDKMEASWK